MDKLVSLLKNNKFQSFLSGVLGGFIVFLYLALILIYQVRLQNG